MREQDPRGTSVGHIEKRRETMADGRRYLIYYTFEPLQNPDSSADKVSDSTTDHQKTTEETENV